MRYGDPSWPMVGRGLGSRRGRRTSGHHCAGRDARRADATSSSRTRSSTARSTPRSRRSSVGLDRSAFRSPSCRTASASTSARSWTSHGVVDVPVITNDWDEGAMTFPNGHDVCIGCGTCKMRAVLEAPGPVAFVGEGDSDRFGALYADIVFAKDALVAWCERDGVPFVPWRGLRRRPESLWRPRSRSPGRSRRSVAPGGGCRDRSGGRGIRTLETHSCAYTLSRRAPSSARAGHPGRV